MTRSNVTISLDTKSLRTEVDEYFIERGLGYNANTLYRARLKRLVTLKSKSDAELAMLGVSRDQIIPHVFRDIFG